MGTGKTTLIRALLDQLDKKVTVAAVKDPGLAPMDFFNFIAAAYGLRKHYTNKVDFLFDFEELLHKIRAAGRTALLIVDEAQRLDQTLLEEIRLLSNIEDPDQKLLNVFFVGQEEFLDIISAPENRALRQRITVNYHLENLNDVETEALVRHRLKVAGTTQEVFTPDAFPGIFAFSMGAPRLINILCDHALLTGFVKDAPTIGADIIAECIEDLRLPGEHGGGPDHHSAAIAPESAPAGAMPETPPPKPTAATVTAGLMLQNAPAPVARRRWPWAAAALLLLIVGAGFLWRQGWPPLTNALNLARVTPSVRVEATTPEAATTPEPAASHRPGVSERPTPAPVVPATNPAARPQATLPAAGRDAAEETGGSSTAALPKGKTDMDLRQDAGDEELTPDSRSPQPMPVTAQAELLIGHEIPDPLPTENVAAIAPVDKTATGGNRQTPSVPKPEERAETPSGVRSPNPIQETNDTPVPPLPAPTATAGPAAARALAGGAGPPSKESLPDAGPPVAPPPATPVKVARTAPAGRDPSPLASLPKPASSDAAISGLGLPTDANMTTSPGAQTAPAPSPAYATEDKIRDFIRSYRKAYESLDIDRFRLFFTEDAIEMNRPFSAALPVYQRNFGLLSALEYDITLKSWEEDEATGLVSLDGIFDIRYRTPESAWRNTQGDIRMDLAEIGGVYRIKRLDYQKE